MGLGTSDGTSGGASEGTVVVSDFELAAGRWVLAVVDGAGRPVEGAEVRLRAADALDPETSPRRTDAAGRATWSAVPEGATATADVEGPDGVVARAALPAASSAPPVVTATLRRRPAYGCAWWTRPGAPPSRARRGVPRGDGVGAVRVVGDVEAGTAGGGCPARGRRPPPRAPSRHRVRRRGRLAVGRDGGRRPRPVVRYAAPALTEEVR
jgi:hypothetical protein